MSESYNYWSSEPISVSVLSCILNLILSRTWWSLCQPLESILIILRCSCLNHSFTNFMLSWVSCKVWRVVGRSGALHHQLLGWHMVLRDELTEVCFHSNGKGVSWPLISKVSKLLSLFQCPFMLLREWRMAIVGAGSDPTLVIGMIQGQFVHWKLLCWLFQRVISNEWHARRWF